MGLCNQSSKEESLCHMKRKGKSEISVVQRKLWEECRRIIRARYPHVCYTCGAGGLEGVNLQTGHMWAKASLGAYLKYDLRILRPQCLRCNLHLGGMGAVFFNRMLKENGRPYLNRLEKDRQVEVRALEHYKKTLEQYNKIIS